MRQHVERETVNGALVAAPREIEAPAAYRYAGDLRDYDVKLALVLPSQPLQPQLPLRGLEHLRQIVDAEWPETKVLGHRTYLKDSPVAKLVKESWAAPPW